METTTTTATLLVRTFAQVRQGICPSQWCLGDKYYANNETIVMKMMITIMMNGSPLRSLARALFDQSTKSLPETDGIR